MTKYAFAIIICLLGLLPQRVEAQVEERMLPEVEIVSKDSQSTLMPRRYRYRVCFKDKADSPYSLERPGEFLSAKSLARRKKFGLKVDQYDLPVSPTYLKRLRERGFKVLHQSKWNNSAVIETTDTIGAEKLTEVGFITSVTRVWQAPEEKEETSSSDFLDDLYTSIVTPDTAKSISPYGSNPLQVAHLGVDSLHTIGLQGQGVTIAVIDGGFKRANRIAGLRGVKIVGTKNFVDTGDIYATSGDHGTMVLSCLAAFQPFGLIGTAPGAEFYLILSEDGASEYPVEEDAWCAAIEYADSVGVDLVNSSLGYTKFDTKTMNHTYQDLNGRTAPCSRAASLAASRGIVVVNSAGNSGDDTWKLIGTPADARDILAVGAVDETGLNTFFSSIGPSIDGRIKPDVMALGYEVRVYDGEGALTQADGTSFASPLLCGGVACLMQAFPTMNPTDLIHLVKTSGNNTLHPDNVFGYGVPNLWKAYIEASKNPTYSSTRQQP